MDGSLRLAFGYALLAIGLLLGLVGGLLSGFSFHFSASDTHCHDHLIGGEHCETEQASVNGDIVGTWLMLPGLVGVVGAVPLIVTGHSARNRRPRESSQRRYRG